MITREQLKFLRKEFGKNITVINPNTKKPKTVETIAIDQVAVPIPIQKSIL